MAGWGAGLGWGKTGWGGGGFGAGLSLLRALPIRENVVRLFFDAPVNFTGILDPNDASDAERYDIMPVEGTVGLDGLPVHDVDPIVATLVLEAGAGQQQIDLTVDRPFSHYPCRYNVTVNQLLSTSGALLVPGFTTVQFDGLARGRVPPVPDKLTARRDIANPQSLDALLDNLPSGADASLLAIFPVDESGDYAADSGLISYKKRVFRRLFTRKGAFAHMPSYGVGVPGQVKKLGKSGVKSAISADAEAQIKLEPETRAVTVRAIDDPNVPSLLWLKVKATIASGEVVNMDVPFSPTGT